MGVAAVGARVAEMAVGRSPAILAVTIRAFAVIAVIGVAVEAAHASPSIGFGVSMTSTTGVSGAVGSTGVSVTSTTRGADRSARRCAVRVNAAALESGGFHPPGNRLQPMKLKCRLWCREAAELIQATHDPGTGLAIELSAEHAAARTDLAVQGDGDIH